MRSTKKFLISLLVFVALVALLPERVAMPVQGATARDWHANTFWFEPWGTSGVHKGIDIFARKGTALVSTTDGLVLYTGHITKGGNVVVVLGPEWKIHYFAHLDSITTFPGAPVFSGQRIGTVGDSGNARGKPPHLHYSIVRLYPVPWDIDGSTQGYKKAFFIDPGAYLSGSF